MELTHEHRELFTKPTVRPSLVAGIIANREQWERFLFGIDEEIRMEADTKTAEKAVRETGQTVVVRRRQFEEVIGNGSQSAQPDYSQIHPDLLESGL